MDVEIELEVSHRLNEGTRGMGELNYLCRSRGLFIFTKGGMMEGIIPN